MNSLPQRIYRVFKRNGWTGVYRRARHYLVKNHIYKKIFPYHLGDAYDETFFAMNLADSRPVAEYLAPKIVAAFDLKNLVDFGAATGHWVNALNKAGTMAIGIEGSRSAKPYLVCDPEKMFFCDLRKPLQLKKFPFNEADAVLSIEVAEHIEKQYADMYIGNMLLFKPKIIFMTAAIPGQGGHFHVNEQSNEYWIEKFKMHGYHSDFRAKELIASFCEEGRKAINPPPIMRWPAKNHTGVWIPRWMPKNLLVFRKS